MKIIRKNNAMPGKNDEKCTTLEYSFNDKDIDVGVATITGRYPEKDYCVNTICKELVFVLEGTGSLCFQNEKVDFSKGDAILIEPNEKYYWDTEFCIVSMTCTPSWSPEQYKLMK